MPGGLEVRYLALLGALREIAEVSTATMPRGPEYAELSALARVLSAAELSAASGFRRRPAERFRGLYVLVDPALPPDRDPVCVARPAPEGGAPAPPPRRDGPWARLQDAEFLTLHEKRENVGLPPRPDGDVLPPRARRPEREEPRDDS